MCAAAADTARIAIAASAAAARMRVVRRCGARGRGRVQGPLVTSFAYVRAEIAKLALSIADKWASALIVPKGVGADGTVQAVAKSRGGTAAAAGGAASGSSVARPAGPVASAAAAGPKKQNSPTSASTLTLQTVRDQRVAAAAAAGAGSEGAPPVAASPWSPNPPPPLPEVLSFRSEPSACSQPELFQAPSVPTSLPAEAPSDAQGETYKAMEKPPGSILSRPHGKGGGRLKKLGAVKFASELEKVRALCRCCRLVRAPCGGAVVCSESAAAPARAWRTQISHDNWDATAHPSHAPCCARRTTFFR